MTTRGRRQGGYTLIEVLVAFAVLAVSMTLLLGILARASQEVHEAAEASRATLHARSLLEEVAGVGPIEVGRTQGNFEDGRFDWELSVEPWTDIPGSTATPESASAPGLVKIDLEVRWGSSRGERLHVQSLRLVRRDTVPHGMR